MIANNWVLIGVVFLTYFIVSWVYKRVDVTNLEKALPVRNGIRFLNLKHGLGIVLFGILFYVIFPSYRYLICEFEIAKLEILIPFFILTFLSAGISNMTAKGNLGDKIGFSNHSFSEAMVYFTIRFIFLLCYEFFFRGVLFFMFLDHFSLFIAITLSTILYFISHLFDSKKELIRTIPFGVLLCILTYYTSSIWYAFIVHLALSATYEISIFYYKTIKTFKS
ncbi:CPBP family intramembrane glutamic endopeptidase [Seonamhaeicola aphaedonensis]|uniref:CAAX prenyl protease-like protein n=1 Tax=Seonamhaeicola aphaedonensis TaxID=1461338 RepID=A0A3D9HL03_9FLAO|nr:CPBP family intramembrane glutamic endopeptidase [Seonamhaeicola aphaedonensis]RED50153.1 CAAX prenyl protease-like protein [Seonamhaeicola aphaedonensis]